ncbi:MAG: ArsR family transcriptional regulator, partial [Candidatus Aenigmatarchaeota archaeon]
MGNRIRLDSDVFKALSSDTRMNILRNLSERRMTVTELSDSLEVSKSTVHEHL